MTVFANIQDAGRPPDPVVNSAELQRIIYLPRRALKRDDYLVDAMNKIFCKGQTPLRWIQAAALHEAAIENGLFGPIGVGHGKTLITLLMPTAMDSKSAVLLVPAQLKKKTLREINEFYDRLFEIPHDLLHIHSYEELSRAATAELLTERAPDLIILDEAHKLKRPQSARTKRFLRYMRENPGCRLVALSGTVTNRSLTDYAHLVELALGKGSPLPKGYRELVDWGGALDVDPLEPKSPGALRKLCEPGENVREGFRRRLVETPGVIATADEGFAGSIEISMRNIAMPVKVVQVREKVTDTWEIGEEAITEATHFGRVMKQLACGFYYRWAWPNDQPDVEWLDARRQWHREMRHFLKHRSRAGLDSPLLVTRAVKSGKIEGDLCQAWLEWSKVMDRPEPATIPVWVDPFVVKAAAKWARGTKGGIIWYEHRAFADAFRACGLPVYGPGDDASEAIADVIVCSIRAQGTGKNLQRYSKNLIVSMPSSGEVLEQLIGRTHRPGQEADEVTVEWFGHALEMHKAFDGAIADAEYMQQTTGQRQKLLLARRL